MIERTDTKRVSGEVIVRRSIILDHIPTNFDVAFTRAREALMLDRGPTENGGLPASMEEATGAIHLNDNVQKASDEPHKSVLGGLWGTLAKVGLAGTTHVEGGEGHAMGPSKEDKGAVTVRRS